MPYLRNLTEMNTVVVPLESHIIGSGTDYCTDCAEKKHIYHFVKVDFPDIGSSSSEKHSKQKAESYYCAVPTNLSEA